MLSKLGKQAGRLSFNIIPTYLEISKRVYPLDRSSREAYARGYYEETGREVTRASPLALHTIARAELVRGALFLRGLDHG